MKPKQSTNPDELLQRAFSLHRSGDLSQASSLYERLLKAAPKNPLALKFYGVLQLQRGKFREAVQLLGASLQIAPSQPDALSYRGTALQNLNRLEEAVANFDRAIALQPDFSDAHSNRGLALHELKRFNEALASCDRAIAIKPDFAEAHNNRGRALQELGRAKEAVASFDRAIALNPGVAALHNNRANALQLLRRETEALASINRAISLEPNLAAAYWGKAFLKLLMGDFEEGWKLYEWRWKGPLKDYVRNFKQPLWLGDQSVAGKTLLIHAEQGLGDFVQFCRYAPMAETLGAKIILEVPSPLISLISTLKGNFRIVESGKPLPHFDLHCPMMSLPLAFKTTLTSIPASVPYLAADAAKQETWQRRLGQKTKPRVGLAWSGSAAAHLNNYQKRSIPLQLLRPLLGTPVEFHSLQKEIPRDEEALLPEFPHLHVHCDELGDFSDTAALVQEMDLVIAVDTSVAHLAGAMGKPVWILLPFLPDQRWLLDRSDSPWYPTATLFRQPEFADWPSVITGVEKRLRDFT